MKIRRFFAKDMRTALQKVNEELGSNAAIMSTRKTNGGVEVVAAQDYDALMSEVKRNTPEEATPKLSEDRINLSQQSQHRSEVTQTLQPTINNQQVSPELGNNRFQRPEPKHKLGLDIEWSQEPNLVAVREEVKLMRELLQDQLGELAWQDQKRREPIQANMLKRLIKMGLPASLAKELSHSQQLDQDPECAWQQIKLQLKNQISETGDDILETGGIAALVGPTGVGKTTTIAKLAARYLLKHGPDSVALVTTDSYRVAAHEQLRTYANIMGISMRIAHDASSLQKVLHELRDKSLVLIDTAGISQRDKRLIEQMQCLINAQMPIRYYLVLSTTSQTSVLRESTQTFGHLPLQGTILTKLDETRSLGESIGTILQQGLSLSYLTDGQRVPDDLHVGRTEVLINKAVSLAENSQNDNNDDWFVALQLNQQAS